MRVIFMGTPEFGVPILESILKSKHKVVAVVCQPDRQANRKVITKPPVKVCAELSSLEVLQFNRISKEGVDTLKSYNADIMVTAAYGQILSDEILNLTPNGVINVHASLLPLYRGSSPIHHAILNGESITGVTIMQTAREVDSGDIILQEELPIKREDNTGTLTSKLSELGAELIVQALDDIENGKAVKVPQDHNKATHYPMLSKEDGRINYDKSPEEFFDFVRGMYPWPSAFTFIDDTLVKLLEVSIVDRDYKGAIGEVVEANPKTGLIVKVNNGTIKFNTIQPQGKKAMKSEDYLLGRKIAKGTILC